MLKVVLLASITARHLGLTAGSDDSCVDMKSKVLVGNGQRQ
jgi:hypothetical protein